MFTVSLPDVIKTDWCNDNIFFHDPVRYLPGLTSDEILSHLRKAKIILAVGGGSWEEEAKRDSKFVCDVLKSKGVDCWYDEWGPDMHHDWPTWRAMAPYHFGKMLEWDSLGR
jgi:esterase/lipase superfamily enzyme